METTRQTKSAPATGSLGHEVDVNFDDEDPESVSDFAEFQRWLDSGSPARPSGPRASTLASSSNVAPASSDMPPPAAPSVPGCKCFKNPCSFTNLVILI